MKKNSHVNGYFSQHQQKKNVVQTKSTVTSTPVLLLAFSGLIGVSSAAQAYNYTTTWNSFDHCYTTPSALSCMY